MTKGFERKERNLRLDIYYNFIHNGCTYFDKEKLVTTSPTRRQVAFAHELGIDIPEVATRTELSELIDHALIRRRIEDSGLHALPNETPRWATGGIKSEAYVREACEAIRTSDIAQGDIVKRGCRLYAVRRFDLNGLFLKSLETGSVTDFTPLYRDDSGCLRSNAEFVYRPPSTHVYWRLILPSSYSSYSRKKGQFTPIDFQRAIRARLAPEEKYTNEYGEFWLREAVERLRQDVKQVVVEKRKARVRYCTVCGRECTYHLRNYRCSFCFMAPFPLERHCIRCGATFKLEPSMGCKGGRAFLCPTHRKLKG